MTGKSEIYINDEFLEDTKTVRRPKYNTAKSILEANPNAVGTVPDSFLNMLGYRGRMLARAVACSSEGTRV